MRPRHPPDQAPADESLAALRVRFYEPTEVPPEGWYGEAAQYGSRERQAQQFRIVEAGRRALAYRREVRVRGGAPS